MDRQTTLERAFELAQTGACRTVGEIRSQLKKEQLESVDAHLSGHSIQRQLRGLLAARRPDDDQVESDAA